MVEANPSNFKTIDKENCTTNTYEFDYDNLELPLKFSQIDLIEMFISLQNAKNY